MFYINLDITYQKRYDMGRFLEFFEADEVFDITSSYLLNNLKNIPANGNYVVTDDEYFLDLISYRIYGRTWYWWILMEYNDIVDFTTIKSGTIIQYPSLDDVEDLYFVLKSKEVAIS